MRSVVLVIVLMLFAAPAVLAAVGHDAAQLRAGTFGIGNYVFPQNVTINNNTIVINNVGIGTASPGDKLQINSNWFDSDTNTWGGGIRIVGTYPTISFWESDDGGHRWMWHLSQDTMNLYRRPAGGSWERKMVVDTSGNVGIGVVPSAKLDVAGSIRVGNDVWHTSQDGKNRLHFSTNSRTFFGSQNGYSFRSAADGDILTLDNSGLLSLQGYAYISNSAGVGGLELTSGHQPGVWAGGIINSRDGGGSARGLLLQTNGGAVGINRVDPGYALDVNGVIRTTNDGPLKPSAGQWGGYSDARLKKNIQPLNGALDKISRIPTSTFEWKNPELHVSGIRAGVVAQDLQKVFPEWVSKTKPEGNDTALIPSGEDALVVAFPGDFNAYLIESIKELKSQNDALKASDDAKQSQIDALKAIVCRDHPSEQFCR